MEINRRSLLKGMAATGVAAAVASGATQSTGAPFAQAAKRHKITGPADGKGYSVGIGISSMTGAVAGQGMMGYSEPEQVARGLRSPYYARAFIFVDNKTKERLVYVNVDMACFFEALHQEVIKHCAKKYGKLYPESHLCITATHNHNSCGGTSHNMAYNTATSGFMENSFKEEVAGICEAIDKAHRAIRPATLLLGHAELHNASANRSAVAFERNPESDKAYYPEKIDPQVRVLRIQQAGEDVGAITWFATHGTSLTDANFYIAPDNKGLASYMWEHDEKGVRYLRGHQNFVVAFSQTNAGDMTPNLGVKQMKPTGPAGTDFVKNNAIIAKRQYDACKKAFESATPISGAHLDVRYMYVDMAHQVIDGKYTHDGKRWRTSPAIMGGSGAACSMEDNVRCPTWDIPFIREGWQFPAVEPKIKSIQDAMKKMGIKKVPELPREDMLNQYPKVPLLPLGYLPPTPWNPQIVPAQIIRLCDQLTICANSSECTIAGGLRVRRQVAKTLDIHLEDVIYQGYTNSYNQYITTPEEYTATQYEAGETQYGIETLGAWIQAFDELAQAMRDGKTVAHGPSPLKHEWFHPTWLAAVPPDTCPKGKKYGDVLVPSERSYRKGQTAQVDFVGAHPNNRIRRNSTYTKVEQKKGGSWVCVYDDSDYETMFHWERPKDSKTESITRVIWNIPTWQEAGTYRLVQLGESRDKGGKITSYVGTSPAFRVS